MNKKKTYLCIDTSARDTEQPLAMNLFSICNEPMETKSLEVIKMICFNEFDGKRCFSTRLFARITSKYIYMNETKKTSTSCGYRGAHTQIQREFDANTHQNSYQSNSSRKYIQPRKKTRCKRHNRAIYYYCFLLSFALFSIVCHMVLCCVRAEI